MQTLVLIKSHFTSKPLVRSLTSSLTYLDDAAGIIHKIREKGMRVGIALKPNTPISQQLLDLVPSLDQVLIMTVEPGFGGQKLMPSTLAKV
jgi:ribulose-phosphate 3-epimerase